jgi:hypothetical protein
VGFPGFTGFVKTMKYAWYGWSSLRWVGPCMQCLVSVSRPAGKFLHTDGIPSVIPPHRLHNSLRCRSFGNLAIACHDVNIGEVLTQLMLFGFAALAFL